MNIRNHLFSTCSSQWLCVDWPLFVRAATRALTPPLMTATAAITKLKYIRVRINPHIQFDINRCDRLDVLLSGIKY